MKRISGFGTKRHYQVVLHQKVLVRFEIAILTGSHLRSERIKWRPPRCTASDQHINDPYYTSVLMSMKSERTSAALCELLF